MSRVCHVLTNEAGWAQRIALGPLLRKADPAHERPLLAVAGPFPRWLVGVSGECECVRLPAHGPYLGIAGLSMRIRRQPMRLIHAWGAQAATMAAPASRRHGAALLIHLHVPPNPIEVKRLRGIGRDCGASFICSCQIVRRRLLEGGVRDDRCVVVRPGVDFSAINRWKQSPGQAGLGAERGDFVVVLGEADPADRVDALVGVNIHSRLRDQRVCAVLLPGARDTDRLLGFTRDLSTACPLWPAPSEMPREQVIALADAILMVPRGDISTTEIAWAMASRTAVVGTANYAVTELIAHKLNGLLIKREPGRPMAPAIARVLADRDAMAQGVETAHGQAFEVFSVRRFVDQVRAVYENVVADRPPAEGVVDSASAA
jgi:glycosyltransferase involved in cell wall biosynthesis